MENYLIEGGKIVTTHGVRGELKVNPTCDSAEFLKSVGKYYVGGKLCECTETRVHKNMLLIKIKGVDTVDAAIPYIGKSFCFDKRDAKLPEHTYFHCDLIGMEVYDTRLARVIGHITSVMTLPANDVYVVTEGENEYLIPAAPVFIESVDVENKAMTVTTIEGMV